MGARHQNSGQIVGYYVNNGSHGFLLSGGTYTTLDDPSATQGTVANGINASGQIVGYYTDSSFTTHGFLLSGTYTTLDDPLATNGSTYAYGINASGQIVGLYTNNAGNHGFRLSGGIYTTLDDPLATQGTSAQGINSAGMEASRHTSGSASCMTRRMGSGAYSPNAIYGISRITPP